MGRVLGSLAMLAILAVSCGEGPILGDQSHEAWIHNASDTTVIWYDPGGAEYAPGGSPNFRLAPGETHHTNWLVDRTTRGRQEVRYTPKAFDDSKTLVFCRTYTWDELENIGWRIDVVKDEISCK